MTRRFACLALMLLLAAPLRAADFHVFNTNDSGPGSLRQGLIEALADPDDDQQIWFHASYPLDASVILLSPLPSLSDKTRIALLGNARNPRILAPADSMDGILRAESSLERLHVDGLRLEGGRHALGGGCIRGTHSNINLTAILRIANSELIDCRVVADGAQAVNGGAVMWNSPVGEVTILDSVFRDNAVQNGATGTAYGSGGAIFTRAEHLDIQRSGFYNNEVRMVHGAGGAVAAEQFLLELSVTDSVFANNVVQSDMGSDAVGGAMWADCFEDCAIDMQRNYFGENRGSHGGALYLRRGNVSTVNIEVHLANNTFHDNVASAFGGALYLGRAAFELAFNTLQGSQATTGAHLYLLNGSAGEITHNVFGAATGLPCYFYTLSTGNLSGGHNAFVDGGCASRLQPDATVWPTLGDFTLDLGATMPVLAFDAGSPVTDGGDMCLGVDARQTPRPLDGDGDGVALCDIGAFERPAAPPAEIFADGFED